MKKIISATLAVWVTIAVACAAPLQVAALHPLIADLATEIGGQEISVWSVLPDGADLHRYEPSPRDIIRLSEADVILASGKNLEPFLDRLISAAGGHVRVVEVGRSIRSLQISAANELFVCCPEHSAGSIDPHWWHSVPNWKKAAQVVAEAFSKARPEVAPLFKNNLARSLQRLSTLDQWVRSQINSIPKKQRVLATAHLAFSYLCEEYGLRALPVQGLSADNEPTASYLAATVAAIQKNNVKAIFPEKMADMRTISLLARESGVKIGAPLDADGTTKTVYEEFMRHNVSAIVSALR